ncbi:putative leader peptide [Streptomyces tamarix]|uniref:putative leader peptide n=1 Tax=Streptomyces tamarix TaxID=3078565 RepID=UPI00370380E2
MGSLSRTGPDAPDEISYAFSREVLTAGRGGRRMVAMSSSTQQPFVRRRHVDLRRVASAICPYA